MTRFRLTVKLVARGENRSWLVSSHLTNVFVGEFSVSVFICSPLEGGDLTGEWRKLRNEELNDLYSLPNIVRVVKSRRMRWAGHVARMGEDRGVHKV